MDKNRIEGAARQAKGTIKEAVGKVTGNRDLEIEVLLHTEQPSPFPRRPAVEEVYEAPPRTLSGRWL